MQFVLKLVSFFHFNSAVTVDGSKSSDMEHNPLYVSHDAPDVFEFPHSRLRFVKVNESFSICIVPILLLKIDTKLSVLAWLLSQFRILASFSTFST